MLAIVFVSFIASLLTLFSGFGLGTLLMPVVAMFFPIATAIALTALIHLLNNLFKLGLLWRHVDWRTSLVFGIPAVLATLPGAWFLIHLDRLPEITNYHLGERTASITPVKLIVGILLITFAIIEGCNLTKKIHIPFRFLPFGGLLSGFFGGLSGHQGAFRSVFLLHTDLSKNRFVATNAAISTLVDTARLTIYGLNFSLLLEQVDHWLIGASATAALAGVVIGTIFLRKITIGLIQKILVAMLTLLGFSLMLGII